MPQVLPLQRCLWFTCSRPASVLFKPPSPRTKHRKVSRHAEKALQSWGLPCLGLPKAAWDSFAAAWARVLGAAGVPGVAGRGWFTCGGDRGVRRQSFCSAGERAVCVHPDCLERALLQRALYGSSVYLKVYQDWLARPSKSTKTPKPMNSTPDPCLSKVLTSYKHRAESRARF